jgi:hypothetical protein
VTFGFFVSFKLPIAAVGPSILRCSQIEPLGHSFSTTLFPSTPQTTPLNISCTPPRYRASSPEGDPRLVPTAPRQTTPRKPGAH